MSLPDDLQQSIDGLGAVVCRGFPWWLRLVVQRGVSGITLGRRIYIRHGIADLRRLLLHELQHVRQIERLGVVGFYTRYLREYAAHRWRGLPPEAAYRRISLEIEAFAAEQEESV